MLSESDIIETRVLTIWLAYPRGYLRPTDNGH